MVSYASQPRNSLQIQRYMLKDNVIKSRSDKWRMIIITPRPRTCVKDKKPFCSQFETEENANGKSILKTLYKVKLFSSWLLVEFINKV